jgi:predicted acylesterase/phospholipase RssA
MRTRGGLAKVLRRGLVVGLLLTGASGSAQAEPAVTPPVAPSPGRPVRMRQWFNDCLVLARRTPGSPEAKACFTELAPAFRAGRDAQCQLWDIPTDSDFCRGRVVPPPPQAEQRGRTLTLMEAVASDLDQAAASGRFDDGRHVADLFVAASNSLLPEQRHYSVVSQGGVSLGSWQAGYLYLVTEVMKSRAATLGLDPTRSVFTTATGASAGAVNALAYGVEGCRRAFRSPEETLGFKIWVDLLALFGTPGQPGLFDEQDNPLAIFHDGPIERSLELARGELINVGRERKEKAGREAAQHASAQAAACSFNLGFVVTHMKPRRVPVHVRVEERGAGQVAKEVQMTVPRLSERFMLEVGVDESGQPFANNLEAQSEADLAYPSALPDAAFVARLGRSGVPTISDLLNGVRASGAFPLAFSPVWLDYQTWDVEPSGYRSHRSRFVDGGTLDNTPIGLAATINRRRPFVSKNPWFADLFSDPNTYLFVNPGVTDWNTAPMADVDATSESETMLSVFGGFAIDLLTTGFDAQLMNTAEALPFVREDGPASALPRLTVPRRNMPIAGEHLVHFLAFAERDFREFDFVVGMADAYEHLVRQTGDEHLRTALEDIDRRLTTLAKPAVKGPAGHRVPIANRYKCMRAFYAEHIQQDGDLRALRAVPKACAEAAVVSGHPRRDNQLLLLRALVKYRHWARSANYDEDRALYEFIDAVSDEGFDFPDTVRGTKGWSPFESPREALRGLVDKITARLAAKHSLVTGWGLKGVGRVLADASLLREFPSFSGIGIADNGLEGVFGWPLLSTSERFAVRMDATPRAYRWRRLDIQPQPDAWTGSLALSVGPTLVWSPLFNPGTADLEIGGGVYGEARPLPEQWALQAGWSAHLALVAVQRLYLMADFQRAIWQQIDPMYEGTHVDALGQSTLGLTVGWRFNLY